MIIGLLTGRGRQKSLPNKNVYPVLGKPLMAYPFEAAQRSRLLDDLYLSTEDSKIAEVGRSLGVKIIDRPPEFAQAQSQHDACMIHAIDHLRERGIHVEILVVLMCNIAIQPDGKIDQCVQALLDDPELDSAVTIREWGDHHPTRAKRLDDEGNLVPILHMEGDITTTRQQLGDCFYLDHQVWALRVQRCFEADGQPPWRFLGKRVKGILNHDVVLDVHGLDDIKHSEMWLEHRQRRS